MAIRVLLVDDVSDLRELFRRALDGNQEIEVIGEAEDGLQAIEKAEQLLPDVIVLDLAMPRLDGLRAIPRLHAVCPGTRIMVLSGFSSPRLKQHALDACATAFVEKGTATTELAELIEQIYRAPAKSGCEEPA